MNGDRTLDLREVYLWYLMHILLAIDYICGPGVKGLSYCFESVKMRRVNLNPKAKFKSIKLITKIIRIV